MSVELIALHVVESGKLFAIKVEIVKLLRANHVHQSAHTVLPSEIGLDHKKVFDPKVVRHQNEWFKLHEEVYDRFLCGDVPPFDIRVAEI